MFVGRHYEPNTYMQLFRDRNLNIAVLISTTWHLVCMIFVTPVLISNNIRENVNTISFLGSILDRVIAISEKSLILNSPAIAHIAESPEKNDSIDIRLAQPSPPLKILPTISDKEESIMSWDRHREKAGRVHYNDKEAVKIKFKDVIVMGEAKNRMLLYRPEMPDICFLPSYSISDFSAVIKVKISRHGYVGSPECAISSGYPSIDQMFIRYVRKWQFVPDDKEDQEGFIRLSSEGL